jgi:hypothetical protein
MSSNWASTLGGAVQALVPGPSTAVTISNSTITTAPTATFLGTNMTINSLTIADTVNGLGLNGDGNTLTITPSSSANGITMNASVPASTIAATVALGAAQTWTNNNTSSANTLTVSGGVSGSGALTIAGSGTGTTILSGANTYSAGTTITAGTLRVNNTSGSGTGTGAVAVNSGGTLGGSGYIGTSGTANGAITVKSGGTIAAGATSSNTAGTGLLTSYSSSGVALGAGSAYTWKINADTTHSGTAGGATGWDEIAAQSIALGSSGTPLTGTTGSQFTVYINGTPGSGFGAGQQLFPIATAVSGISLNGTAVASGTNLSTSPNSSDFVLSTTGFTAPSSANGLTSFWQLEVVADTAVGTNGQSLDLIYNATPEPGTGMPVLCGGLPLLARRRRRRLAERSV